MDIGTKFIDAVQKPIGSLFKFNTENQSFPSSQYKEANPDETFPFAMTHLALVVVLTWPHNAERELKG